MGYHAAGLSGTFTLWLQATWDDESRVDRVKGVVERILESPHHIPDSAKLGDPNLWLEIEPYAAAYAVPTGVRVVIEYVVAQNPSGDGSVVFTALYDLQTRKLYRDGNVAFFDPDHP